MRRPEQRIRKLHQRGYLTLGNQTFYEWIL
jgi:hypothetical protein